MHRLALATAAALAAAPAFSEGITLALPVDCALGETCFIQNYVDTDPGPGAQDFTCGHLTYDGHKGTDVALATHLEALSGVNALAAAPGVVTATRDGVPDHFLGAEMDFPEGQDCGNGVVIDHGDGWVTQYCHMQMGSIVVQRGEKIDTGAVIGQIGMSGRTAFPHLHISVRHNGTLVDPFNTDDRLSCGTQGNDTLWQKNTPYRAGGLINAGFSFGVPSYDHVKWGKAHAPHISAAQGGLVLWGHLFGTRPGDTMHFKIEGPNGLFSEHDATIDKTQAQAMRAAGRRLHAGNTVPGRYIGTVTLIRDGRELGRLTAETTLTD